MIQCDANHWTVIVAFIWLCHSILEAWLGKTDKVKSGSVIELIITTLWRIIWKKT